MTFAEITSSKGAAFASQTNLLLAQFGLNQKDGDIVDHGICGSREIRAADRMEEC